MATDKPKVLLILDDELLERIDDYRYEGRIPSRNEAIRRLLNDALDRYKSESEAE